MGILDGKIAIITGAGQGLGEGAAHAMTQEGACVALWGRTFEKVERVANDINKAGGRALAIKCDVSIRAEVDEALKKTIEAFGKLDILATNHFAFAPYGTMEDTPLETWDYEYRNNVIGTVNCMQACFPYLKETGKTRHAKVITYGSASGTTGSPTMSAYAASKEAIVGLTRVAAVEWGKYNINVNCIIPTGDSPAWLATKAVRTSEQLEATMDRYLINGRISALATRSMMSAALWSSWPAPTLIGLLADPSLLMAVRLTSVNLPFPIGFLARNPKPAFSWLLVWDFGRGPPFLRAEQYSTNKIYTR